LTAAPNRDYKHLSGLIPAKNEAQQIFPAVNGWRHTASASYQLPFQRGFVIEYMPRKIPLTEGYSAIVDDIDFPLLNAFKWRILRSRKRIYAFRLSPRGDGKRKSILMHRFIMSAGPDDFIDHINNSPLDNRRSNLRLCTRSQNAMNRPKQLNNKSGYKGVSKCSHGFTSEIMKEKKKYYLGTFPNAKEASLAYLKAANALHGEFAHK
jgi:hypothetical protein